MTRVHLLAAFVACAGVPAASRLAGSGALAWTMFSRTESYRLDIASVGADGARRLVAPTSVAALVRGPATRYLAGADRWRTVPAGAAIRAHLAEIARLACATGPYVSIDVELFVRRDLDAEAESSKAHVDCAR